MTATTLHRESGERRNTSMSVPRWAAWLEIVVGSGMLGLWIALIATGEVPEIGAGELDIWFHLVAEFLAAGLLITAGVLAIRVRRHAGPLSLLAFGALGYTAINSAGFYADRSDWVTVGMFVVLALTAASASVAVANRS